MESKNGRKRKYGKKRGCERKKNFMYRYVRGTVKVPINNKERVQQPEEILFLT